MLCSLCLGLVSRAVIRATRCCLIVPPYSLFQCYSLLLLFYCGQINDEVMMKETTFPLVKIMIIIIASDY